jgi:16S rRNA (uracil1498-N3)-methyltransferase
MARFFLPRQQIQAHRATISGAEFNHLRRVLRLRPQDRVVVFDDAGCEHEGIIRSLSEDCGEIEIIRSYRVDNESALKTTLALGLTKGEKIDWVIEKATELGVHTVVPFVSSYTVPKLNERKMAHRSERWQKIALSAAKQCGRVRIPQILALTEFRDLLEAVSRDALRLLFWEKECEQGLSKLKETRSSFGEVVVMIGPEGGFSPQEAALAVEHSFEPVRLGPRILRAETAALAALSAVQLLWGDLR